MSTATEIPKQVQFDMKSGSYEIRVEGKRSFLRIEKPVTVNGKTEMKVRFCPVEMIEVHLTHLAGGTVTIRKTTMGKAGRTSFHRFDNLPLATRVNKEATGPDMVEVPKHAKSLTEVQAKAEIVRMTKCHPDDADTFLSYEGLLAAAG